MITNDDTQQATPPKTGAAAPPTALTTYIDTTGTSASTAVEPVRRLHLGEARAYLAAVNQALDESYHDATLGKTSVEDGHQAVRLIDIATRKLYWIRDKLLGEIRTDQDERAARVERILDEINARPADVAAGHADGGAAA